MENAFLARRRQIGCFLFMKVFHDFMTQYWELHEETACNEKSANAAFRCIKNQLSTRSGWLCGDQSVFTNFGKIAVANPKINVFPPKTFKIIVFLAQSIKWSKNMRYTFSCHIFVCVETQEKIPSSTKIKFLFQQTKHSCFSELPLMRFWRLRCAPQITTHFACMVYGLRQKNACFRVYGQNA